MKKDYIKKISTALIIVGALDLIGAAIVLIVPSIFVYFGAISFAEKAGVVLGSLVSGIIFMACAEGVKKKNKIAYVVAWPLLILILLKLRGVGFILDGFMVYWLIKSKKLFFK